MKTSVLDFIDSNTLREHLRNQTLEPAVECILIVHCRNCSIEKKLEALKERYDTYSKEDFNKGTYYSREIDLKSALKEYIDSTERFLLICTVLTIIMFLALMPQIISVSMEHSILLKLQ